MKKEWEFEFTAGDFDDALSGMRPFSNIYWYAIDKTGRVAICWSSGFGPIPIVSLSNYASTVLFSRELFFGMEFNSHDVVASAKGLFVFDWDSPRGQYDSLTNYELLKKPLRPSKVEQFHHSKHLLTCSLFLDLDFDRVSTFNLNQLNIAVNV